MINKKTPLVISVCIVIPISFFNGFNPNYIFDTQLQTIDEHAFFKLIMDICIGFSILWVLGVLKQQYLKMALVTKVIFMFGLVFSRLLSLCIIGIPLLATYSGLSQIFF